MHPWIHRAIPVLAIPILLLAAVAACGPTQQPPSNNQTGNQTGSQTGARPQDAARMPAIDQLGLAQPARIARAQEEEAPIADGDPATEVSEFDTPQADAPMVEETAPVAEDGQPPVSDVPAPVATTEPATAAPTTVPTLAAGAPTPTLDLETVLQSPSVQTAIAQFSNMAPPLPPIPNQSGQPQAQPATQTQAAVMTATRTVPR